MNANTMQLKQLNTEKVKDILRLGLSVTKAELSKETGLSVATCGNILNDLLDSKEVIEVELASSTGGRPSRQFKLNADYAYTASIYMRLEGSDETLYGIVNNMIGKKVYEETMEIDTITISQYDVLIDKMIRMYPNIQALSVGVPAVVRDGRVNYLCGPTDIDMDLRGHLASKYDISVIVENDVNITALGYFDRFNLGDDEPLAYLYYPKNQHPGVGLIINGKIYRGFTSFAGEVMYLPKTERMITLERDIGDESLLAHSIHTIISMISLLNPAQIILSGLDFTEGKLEQIRSKVKEQVPLEHLPDIRLQIDFHQDYVHGLSKMALELLTCKLQLIEK